MGQNIKNMALQFLRNFQCQTIPFFGNPTLTGTGVHHVQVSPGQFQASLVQTAQGLTQSLDFDDGLCFPMQIQPKGLQPEWHIHFFPLLFC
jgi:hypothetical protein